MADNDHSEAKDLSFLSRIKKGSFEETGKNRGRLKGMIASQMHDGKIASCRSVSKRYWRRSPISVTLFVSMAG